MVEPAVLQARQMIQMAVGHISKFRCAIDGGAHVGDWSRQLALYFEVVHAFEPDPETVGILRRYAPENVVVHHEALGDQVGKCAVMRAAKKPDSRSRFVHAPDMGGELSPRRGKIIEVAADIPMVSIDSLDLDDVDLLKLDLEGAEYHALMGATETVARCRPVVIIEESVKYAGRFGAAKVQARRLLESWGYQVGAHIRPDYLFTWEA